MTPRSQKGFILKFKGAVSQFHEILANVLFWFKIMWTMIYGLKLLYVKVLKNISDSEQCQSRFLWPLAAFKGTIPQKCMWETLLDLNLNINIYESFIKGVLYLIRLILILAWKVGKSILSIKVTLLKVNMPGSLGCIVQYIYSKFLRRDP